MVMGGIDACGNKIWSNSLWDTEQFCDIESQWEKDSRRSIVGRGHIGHNLGSHESFTLYVQSHMRPCFFEGHISLCYIFAVKEVKGHDFWTHLKMCIIIFNPLPLILNSGTEW